MGLCANAHKKNDLLLNHETSLRNLDGLEQKDQGVYSQESEAQNFQGLRWHKLNSYLYFPICLNFVFPNEKVRKRKAVREEIGRSLACWLAHTCIPTLGRRGRRIQGHPWLQGLRPGWVICDLVGIVRG